MSKLKGTKNDQGLIELLSRGVETFVDPDRVFEKKLSESPEKLVIKLGADPTRPDLHLGHAVTLRRLRQFQDRGAMVVFLIGDFTASIGDPTGKDKTRPDISEKEIEKNMESYKKQVGKILRTDKEVFAMLRNSDWFMNVTDITAPQGTIVKVSSENEKEKVEIPFDANSFVGKAILFEQSRMQVKNLGHKQGIAVVTLRTLFQTLRKITHARLIERDMFQNRTKNGSELFLHEMLYPVIQGIDSAVIATIFGTCDLEIGGNDQTFNMLMGRDIMKANGQVPQAVMSMKILTGLDGKEKMSKSLDNYVSIDDKPSDMYGKIMSIPDNLIVEYFELATYAPQSEIEKIKTDLSLGKAHPKEMKMRLARDIVAIYHGEKESNKAEESFTSAFVRGEGPKEIDVISASSGEMLGDILKKNKVVPSIAQFKRLVDGGAIENIESREIITNFDFIVDKNLKLRVGKKKFIEIRIN